METGLATWTLLEADFDWRVPLVVLGAGLARRMGPQRAGRSKVELPIRPGDPRGLLLDGIVGAWAPWASELILVSRTSDPRLERLMGRQPLPARTHLQPEPLGTTSALLGLRDELPERFLVVLGDCLFDGRLRAAASCFPGLAVWPQAEPSATRANYGVRLRGTRVLELEEKPARGAADQVCGLGAYFLDRALLSLLERQAPDARGRRELTDGLALALAQGIDLHAVQLSGRYFNINTPDDLARAQTWFGPR